MSTKRALQIAGGVLLLGLLAWVVTQGLERLVDTPVAERTPAGGPTAPAEGVPRITATLYHATADGQALVAVHQEVALAEGIVQQGRAILEAQLGSPPPPPYVSVMPEGTQLRAFYTTDRGEAFVDLSPEVTTNHPGGSTTELLTVYAIVNAVTENLPAVERVQILIDGREADTLAGHVDLRRPLQRDVSLIRDAQ